MLISISIAYKRESTGFKLIERMIIESIRKEENKRESSISNSDEN